MPTALNYANTFAASVPDVFVLLTDPQFRDAVLATLGVDQHSASTEREGDHVLVRLDIEDHAGAAGKLLGISRVPVEVKERWISDRAAQVSAAAPGLPLHLSADIAVSSAAGTTTVAFTGEVAFKKFGLGGLAESFVKGLLGKVWDEQQKLGSTRLGDHGT